jgi:hypothetical protein
LINGKEIERTTEENNVKGDDTQISFFTGFQSFRALKAFYDFLGPAAESLNYSERTSN